MYRDNPAIALPRVRERMLAAMLAKSETAESPAKTRARSSPDETANILLANQIPERSTESISTPKLSPSAPELLTLPLGALLLPDPLTKRVMFLEMLALHGRAKQIGGARGGGGGNDSGDSGGDDSGDSDGAGADNSSESAGLEVLPLPPLSVALAYWNRCVHGQVVVDANVVDGGGRGGVCLAVSVWMNGMFLSQTHHPHRHLSTQTNASHQNHSHVDLQVRPHSA